MAIDYDGILNKFVSVAVDGVGPLLSKINGVHPAVIRSRQDAPKPDYPYVVLDQLSTTQEDGWLSTEGVDENNNLFYTTRYQILLNYTVYGDAAATIANQLEGFFRLDRVRDSICNDIEVGIVQTNPISSIPQLLADKYVEAAQFSLVINVSDTYTDTSVESVIEGVDIDGSLYEGTEDPTPTTFNITVP